jgi:hypothetical protein
MVYALWITGALVVIFCAGAVMLVFYPPGDNIDARALGELIAVVPAFLACVAAVTWLVLAVIYWLL